MDFPWIVVVTVDTENEAVHHFPEAPASGQLVRGVEA